MTAPANQAYTLGFRSVGEDVVVWPRAHVVGAGRISVGDCVLIDDFAFLMADEPVTLGSFVHIASGVSVLGGGALVIEDFAGVSSGTRIYTGNDDYLGGSLTGPTIPARYRAVHRATVHVGRHGIIGANSVVLPGVTVGEGAAVGALSLVTRDLEPWTVYGGTPARPLRERPKDRILELEAQLRSELYDAEGRYVPRDRRSP